MGRPDVSADVIVDFDHHSDEYNRNELAINAELRRRCPVAWNEHYGGFWFVTGYDAVDQAARDGDTFAHKYEPNAADGVELPGRNGCPAPAGPAAAGHRRGRRAVPPGAAARADAVLLTGRRRRDAAVHGAVGALVSRSADRRRTDGPGARLRQPRSGDFDHEVDGPAVRQLAAVREPLPFRDGRSRTATSTTGPSPKSPR